MATPFPVVMSQKRSGFSLVLSLAIMASMVMMVIVLAAFLQVETRLAQSHSGYMRARLNAMAAAKIALGQLQQLAGPDQRVTMRADMYDKGDAPGATSSTTVPQSGSGDTVWNPSAPKGGKLSHQKRYWTGVWSTGVHAYHGTRCHASGLKRHTSIRVITAWASVLMA